MTQEPQNTRADAPVDMTEVHKAYGSWSEIPTAERADALIQALGLQDEVGFVTSPHHPRTHAFYALEDGAPEAKNPRVLARILGTDEYGYEASTLVFKRQDDEGRLHCENGPAAMTSDGTIVFAQHGVVQPLKSSDPVYSFGMDRKIGHACAYSEKHFWDANIILDSEKSCRVLREKFFDELGDIQPNAREDGSKVVFTRRGGADTVVHYNSEGMVYRCPFEGPAFYSIDPSTGGKQGAIGWTSGPGHIHSCNAEAEERNVEIDPDSPGRRPDYK